MTGIADILYVGFRVPDLGRQQRFLDDFGFVTSRDNGYLLARGTDADRFVYAAEAGDAAFLGLGFEAESGAHLERIAGIDGALLEDLDLPGGGRIARLTDPDGLPVDVVYGINKPDPLPPPSREPLNFGDDRKRLGRTGLLRLADSYRQAPRALRLQRLGLPRLRDLVQATLWLDHQRRGLRRRG